VYAYGIANSTAVKLNDTIMIWNIKPQITPAKEISPALRPCVIDREMRYIILGPGLMTSPNAASANSRRSLIGIMLML
jgi:hypothetical protein